jgi:hypothetical protein
VVLATSIQEIRTLNFGLVTSNFFFLLLRNELDPITFFVLIIAYSKLLLFQWNYIVFMHVNVDVVSINEKKIT